MQRHAGSVLTQDVSVEATVLTALHQGGGEAGSHGERAISPWAFLQGEPTRQKPLGPSDSKQSGAKSYGAFAATMPILAIVSLFFMEGTAQM